MAMSFRKTSMSSGASCSGFPCLSVLEYSCFFSSYLSCRRCLNLMKIFSSSRELASTRMKVPSESSSSCRSKPLSNAVCNESGDEKISGNYMIMQVSDSFFSCCFLVGAIVAYLPAKFRASVLPAWYNSALQISWFSGVLVEIYKKFSIEAAHRLTNLPARA